MVCIVLNEKSRGFCGCRWGMSLHRRVLSNSSRVLRLRTTHLEHAGIPGNQHVGQSVRLGVGQHLRDKFGTDSAGVAGDDGQSRFMNALLS